MARNRSTEGRSAGEGRVETYDSDGGRTPTEHVVHSVADATGRDVLDVGPLSAVIDPDALDTLFEPRFGHPDAPAVTASFRFESCDVTVYADGHVVVALPDDGK